MADAGSLKQRTLRGVVWNFFRVFGQTVFGFVAGIVLARLLPPEDFGLLALATVFIGVADLISSVGMGPAIVQRATLSEQHVRVATTLSLISGTLLTAIFWWLAVPISLFFNEPRVADIIPVLAVGLGISATMAAGRGLLIRKMDFQRLFVIDLGAYLVGYAGISIVMAVLGYGVWSLVAGTVASLVLQSVAIAWVAPPRFPLSLSRREALELLGFGSEISVNNIVNYFARNVDSVVIGKYHDATPLGFYSRAFNLAAMPVSRIASSVSGALFPSYAELQNDRRRLSRAYLKAVNATALLTFPILIGFVISAEPVIVGLYGEAWRPAIVVFQILAFSGLFKTIFHLAGAVAQATNHVRAEIGRQLVYLLILTVGSLALVERGIEAVASVVVVASLWMYLSMAHLVRRIVGFSWRDFFAAQIPGVLLSLVVALAEWLVLQLDRACLSLPAPLTLLLVILVSAVAVLLALLFLPARYLGEIPASFFQHLAPRLPAAWRNWIGKRFPADD